MIERINELVFFFMIVIVSFYNDCYSQKAEALFVKNIDSTLYVASKYNGSYDLITTWNKCMANDLFTFEFVALYLNSSDTINTNVTRPYDTLILKASSTDNIGPILFNGYFAGGNHSYRDSLDVLHQTAECKSITILNNDTLINGNIEFYTDTISINVVNDIFNPPDLPVKNVYIRETVNYKLYDCSIETKVTHEIMEDLNINRYYGMQVANNSNVQKKVLFLNSQYSNELSLENGLNSGSILNFPDVYKVFHYNDDKTITQETFLSPDEGLFLETDEFISSTGSYSRSFLAGSTVGLLKTYFNQIRNKNVVSGDSYYWKGIYSWFDYNEHSALGPEGVVIENLESNNLITYQNVIGAKSYNIYRSDNPVEGFVLIGNSITLKYIDIDISGGNKYFYRVTTVY